MAQQERRIRIALEVAPAKTRGHAQGLSVEQGLAGCAPNSPAPFAALGHLLFGTIGAFQSAMASHGAEFMADLPKFINIEPIIQVSDVKM